MSSIAHLQALREAALAQAQEHELLADQSPDNVFYRLTYQQAKERSDELTAKIIELQQQREKEIVEVRLIGKTASRGTLPLDALAVIASSFSDTVQRISRYSVAGTRQSKTLEADVRRRLDLRLASVAPGSTRLFISGQTSPDLFGYSLITQTLDHTFDLLAAEAPIAVLDQVSAVGHHSVVALQRYLRGLHNFGLEAEMSWDTPSHSHRTWYGDKSRLVSLSSMLGRLTQEAPVTFRFTGIVISLSLKGVVEIEENRQGRTVARYFDALLPSIQRLHVGQECSGTMVKQTVVHTTTGLRKSSFVLGNIIPREENQHIALV